MTFVDKAVGENNQNCIPLDLVYILGSLYSSIYDCRSRKVGISVLVLLDEFSEGLHQFDRPF